MLVRDTRAPSGSRPSAHATGREHEQSRRSDLIGWATVPEDEPLVKCET